MARDDAANDGDTDKSRLNRRNYLKLAGATAASVTGFAVASSGAESDDERRTYGYGGKPVSASPGQALTAVVTDSATVDLDLVPVCTDRVDDEAKFRVENHTSRSVTVEYISTERDRGRFTVGGTSESEFWVDAGSEESVTVHLFHDGDHVAEASSEGQSCEVQAATPVEIPDEILDDLTPFEDPPEGPLGPAPTESPTPTETPTPTPTTTSEAPTTEPVPTETPTPTPTPEPTTTTPDTPEPTPTETPEPTPTETPTSTPTTETPTPDPTETTSTETPTPTPTTSTPTATPTTTEPEDEFGEQRYGEYGYGGVPT